MSKRERLARTMLSFLYPSWHPRWGWTEANMDMKQECYKLADEIIEKLGWEDD